MKGYNAERLINTTKGITRTSGNRLEISGDLGISTWGKLDYLKKCGFIITRK